MNCYIFPSDQSPSLPDICGVSTLTDLAAHLRSCGMERIFSSLEGGPDYVEVLGFQEALPLLGNQWAAAYNGMITRQDPFLLRKEACERGASQAVSLACSGRPWLHTGVFTSSDGVITATELAPSPDNTRTNLCFSGLVWTSSASFDPESFRNHPEGSGFILPGYWAGISDREDTLTSFYHVLTGQVKPWPHMPLPENGRMLKSPVPDSTSLKGVVWTGRHCSIGEDCELENCVILNGATVGKGARLRNSLILENGSVPPGCTITDKYLTTLGEENG